MEKWYIIPTPMSAGIMSDRERAATELEASRDALVDAVKGLPDDRWMQRGSPEGWSILEVVEHVAVVDHGTMRLLTELLPAAQPAPPRSARDIEAEDRRIGELVIDRTKRIEAPDRVRPKSRWATPADALAAFAASRQKLLQLSRSIDERELRARVFPHPVFGAIDGLQWIRAAAGHTMRHVAQIRELAARSQE